MFSAPEVSLTQTQDRETKFTFFMFYLHRNYTCKFDKKKKHRIISSHSLHGVIHLLRLPFSQGLLQGAQVERVWVLHPGNLKTEQINIIILKQHE